MTEPVTVAEVTAVLGEDVIARIDALATQRAVSRDVVLADVVRSGLDVEEGALRRLIEEGGRRG